MVARAQLLYSREKIEASRGLRTPRTTPIPTVATSAPPSYYSTTSTKEYSQKDLQLIQKSFAVIQKSTRIAKEKYSSLGDKTTPFAQERLRRYQEALKEEEQYVLNYRAQGLDPISLKNQAASIERKRGIADQLYDKDYRKAQEQTRIANQINQDAVAADLSYTPAYASMERKDVLESRKMGGFSPAPPPASFDYTGLSGRPQYSSAYGYSTPTGYAEIFYNKEVPKTQSREEMGRETAERFNRRLYLLSAANPQRTSYSGLSQGIKLYAPQAYKQAKSDLLKAEYRVFTRSIDTKRRLYSPSSIGINEQPTSFGGKLALGIADSPNKLIQNPGAGAISIVDTAALSVAGGAALGGASTFIARGTVAGGGIRAARVLNTAVGVGFGGALGYQTYRDPYGTGLQTPQLIVGGAGFVGGYRAVVPKKGVTFKPAGRIRTLTDTRTETGRFVTITGRQRFRYVAQEFGQTKTGYATAELKATTPAQSSYGPYRYNVRSRINYIDVAGKTQTLTGKYRAIYDPSFEPGRGVFAGTGKQGQFEVQISRPGGIAYTERGRTVELVGVRTTVFQKGRVLSVAEGINVRESTFKPELSPQSRRFARPGEAYSINDVTKSPYGFVRYQKSLLTGATKTIKYDTPGTQFVLPTEARGYKLLQTYGYYREPLAARTRRAATSTTEAVNRALFESPRRTYSGLYFEFKQPDTVLSPQRAVNRPPTNIPELNLIPVVGSARSPRIVPVTVSRSLQQQNTFKISRTETFTRSEMLPREESTTIQQQPAGQVQIPKIEYSSRTITRTEVTPREYSTSRFTIGTDIPIIPPPTVPPPFIPRGGSIVGALGGRRAQSPSKSRTGFRVDLETVEGISLGRGVRVSRATKFTGFERRVRSKRRRKR